MDFLKVIGQVFTNIPIFIYFEDFFGNIISIIEIIVNIILAIYIAKIIQERVNNKRALNDFLISEINELKYHYKDFFSKLYMNKYNFYSINEWFKIMTMRIEILNESPEFTRIDEILEIHNSIRNSITNSESFNDQFSDTYFEIPTELKHSLISENKKLMLEIFNCIKAINKN